MNVRRADVIRLEQTRARRRLSGAGGIGRKSRDAGGIGRWRFAPRLGLIALAISLLFGVLPAPIGAEARVDVNAAIVESGAVQVPGSAAASAAPWSPPATAYRVKVDADGLYGLTYTVLTAAGLPIDTLDPRSFQLFYMGQEVPIRVVGEEDGHFDATDVLLFYGRSVDSLFLDGILPTNKYTGTNIYWLTYACAEGPCVGPYGAWMTDVDGSGAGDAPTPFQHREHLLKSQWYFSAYPFEQNADHWFADWMAPSQTNPLLRRFHRKSPGRRAGRQPYAQAVGLE